jgi:hypothetical protein
MNADLTINTLAFKTVYSDQSGSLRREVSRGPNLPTELQIKHQDYTDSATKLPGKRTVVRFDRFVAHSNGTIVPVSAYAVIAVPTDTNITATDINAVCQHLNNSLFAATGNTSGLDLADDIAVNGEQ